MIKDLQENAEKWKYCWLFQVGAMRNTHLKTVRKLWQSNTARIFFGRSAVMAKALGTTPEEEHRMGIHKLAKQIQGQVGVLFTDTEPDEVIEWFADFQQPDFARAGNIASRTVILPPGPVMRTHSDPPEPFPHNEEPQLRKLRGTVNERASAAAEAHRRKMVVFRVALISRWSAATGDVELGDAGDDVEDAMDE
ncbi:ribosomal protein L10-domain-containing protein [Mycena olivaceomarginata]|nr:ribosomal protein L10-domain-containing protein [Mycena olivaceomarginata]